MTRNIESCGRARVFRRDTQKQKVGGDRGPGNSSFTAAAQLLLSAVYVALTLLGPGRLAYGVSVDQPIQDACSLQGTVRLASQQDKALPVPGVLVKLTGVAPGSKVISTATDADGHYRFNELTAGTYTVDATLEGFTPFHETVTLQSAEAKVEDITLQLSKVVQKVEVQDKATAVSTQETPSTASINSREIINLPLAEQKFKEALPIVPGIVRTREGKLNIKGSPENQGMLLVDSVQTVDPVTGSFSIPVPVDVIDTMDVYKTPYSSEYGGFSGGLTAIQTKPPSGHWDVGIMDFIPGIRGKAGHIVGIAMESPRLFFDGPIIKNKLNFAEAVTYGVVKSEVYGLAWPRNETKQQGFDTYTSFQVLFSAKHILSFDVNGFSQRRQFANIRALVPQSASADDGQRGVSLGANDKYQFDSGAVLSAVVRYTRFDSNSHGQGPDDMLISPEGWSGNFFNQWARTANHLEAVPLYQFSPKTYLGRHDLKVGADLIHSSFNGTTLSHPVQLLRQDDSLAEQIDFQGGSPLRAQDTEVSEFVQDHWMFNSRAAVDLGARLTTQSIGRSAALAPRAGLVYAPGTERKTILRAGAGLFYGGVPLLAADFIQNPTRVVSFFDATGAMMGQPDVLQNTYVQVAGDGALIPTGRDLNTSARDFTGNAEIDREIGRGVSARVSYIYSRTEDLYVVTPVLGNPGEASFLALAKNGGSHYHEAEASVRYRPSERSEVNAAYISSRGRGDLNTLSDTFAPFEQPVIRGNVTGVLPSDIPNRFVSWAVLPLRWHLTFTPVLDIHSGLPYSDVDVLENYVGIPNDHRYPTYFSFDVRIYREFKVNMPFIGRMKNQRFRFGLYSLDVTNRFNPLDVYNNVTSPYFGHFVGFQRRRDGFVIDLVK